MAVLVELSPYDPATDSVVTLRATTDDDQQVCALNGVAWWPVLMKAGSYALDQFSASFPGFANSPSSKLELDVSVFPDAPRYSWGDRKVRIWRGEPGTAWPWGQWAEMLCSAASVRDGRLSLDIRVDDAWLDRPVLEAYAGGGGVEGPAALKGAPKHAALGTPKYVAPQLIDAVYNVWQYHGYGDTGSLVGALDRLVRYPASVGDFANFAALVAAAIPPGQFGTCFAQGLVRFGAPPAGPLTLIVNGDVFGTDGLIRRPGQFIRWAAARVGATADQLDLDNLAALDAAAPFNLSLYIAAQTTARELISRIAASVNGLARVNLLGKLQVILPAIGTPVMTLAADGTALPQVTSLELLEMGAPWWRLQMAGDICWRVHGAGEYYEPPAGDIGPAGPAGASAFTLIAHDNVTLTPNSITKVSGGDGWTTGTAYSQEAFVGGAFVSFRITAPDMMVGLSENPLSATRDFSRINYAIHPSQNGNLYASVSGALSVIHSSWAIGDILSVVFDNSGLTHFLQNGVYRGPGAASPLNLKLHADFNVYTQGYSIAGIAYGAVGARGAGGDDGPPAVSASASRKAVNLWAYANGNVVSWADAKGLLTVRSGSVDVTAGATLSAAPSAGVTGTINTSDNVPVAGQPKGYYEVTAMTEKTGTLTLSAVYGGETFTEIFSLSKAVGGYEIVDALPTADLFIGRVVLLETDEKLYRYTSDGWSRSVDGADILANSILTNSLGAGAVTAAKINVTELSAIQALIGILRTASSGARMEIRDNVIKVYDASNVLRVQIGNLTL